MDQARRDQLAARRQLAQLRLERSRVSATYRTLAPQLCAGGARFARLPPVAGSAALKGLTDGPEQDERLLWDDVAGATCQPYANAAQRDALLAGALAELAAPGARLAVIWHPAESGLLIRHGQLLTIMRLLLDRVHGTLWIVAADGDRWLIELSRRDAEICWAPQMPPATAPGR